MGRFFLFSILRQMRVPIIVIIIYYAIAICGFVFIPGIDNNGEEYNVGFFHAFYVIVYTSTTIGFGELPYEWTDNQRLWILISAILGVVLWIYSVGKIISLSQNKVFKEKINQFRFENNVEKIKNPFYILIGYGVTGSLIVKHLKKHNIDVVIIDENEHVFEEFNTFEHRKNLPFLQSNGKNIEILKMAGVESSNCKAVIVATGSEKDNVRIAISLKLLSPKRKIIVRAENIDNINNLVSFNTDCIISSNKIFAEEVIWLLNKKEEYNIREKLNSEVKEFKKTKSIPKGKWIICGYNELTKKIIHYLINNDIEYKVVCPNEINNKIIQTNQVKGIGVTRNDLIESGVEEASVIFSATDDDFKNLSILITARNINPDIYTISTQNKFYRKELFNNAEINLVFQSQYSIASKVYSLISEPYLDVFFENIQGLNKKEKQLLEQSIKNKYKETWHFRINGEKSFFKFIKTGSIKLINILPTGHDIKVLMIQKKDGQTIIEPNYMYTLEEDDVILFTGNEESFCRQQLLMYNINIYNEYQYRLNKRNS